MIPLFCQGKDVQRETSQAVGVGAKEIPTADAADHFRAGQRVFISEPDGSEIEYLGTILSVAINSITVELATQAAKSAGAKLWTPQTLFEWPSASADAAQRSRLTGDEVIRSLGGDCYATRLHSPCEIESVQFENLTDERFEQLSSWFEQQANEGLEEFTYVDASRVVYSVRLEAPKLEWTRTARNLIAVEFKLHLLSEASYI